MDEVNVTHQEASQQAEISQGESLSGSASLAGASRPKKLDLDATTIRCSRSITERILKLAHKHEVQYWLDAPGTDAEKLAKITGECWDLLELLDTAFIGRAARGEQREPQQDPSTPSPRED